MELRPGTSLGSYHLGTTLYNLLSTLQRASPSSTPSHFIWNETDPGRCTIQLSLVDKGIRLLFSKEQRLVRIMYMPGTKGGGGGGEVEYRGKSIRRVEGESVLKLLRRVMGPTVQLGTCHSGSVTAPESTASKGGKGKINLTTTTTSGGTIEEGEETLCYPGVTFIGTRLADDDHSQLVGIIVTPLSSSSTKTIEEAWWDPVLPEVLSIAEGDLKSVEIQLDQDRKPATISLHFHASSNITSSASLLETAPFLLELGRTTTEDITARLGAPVRSFWKEDDRMSIHSSSVDQIDELPNPYFMSYPHLALTLLLDPTSHTLLKILLHSNLPGEINFGRTSKSIWSFTTHKKEDKQRRTNEDDWNAVREILSVERRDEGMMILDRGVEGGEGLKGERSVTKIYGFDGVALEVTGLNQVETVWIF